MKPTWRTQYDEETEEALAESTKIHNDAPSLTQQHHAADADLNTIVRRYGIGDGTIPPAAPDPTYFGDFTGELDFRTALDSVRIATARFDALPVELRKRFNNDPVELFAFVTDPANIEESIKLKLLKDTRPKPEAPPAAAAPAPAPVS